MNLFSVYVIIGMFCIASFIAIYSCLEPLILYSYEVFPRFIVQFPSCNLWCFTINLELRQFLLVSFSFSITIVWLIFRKATWAWILQDSLGIVFSLNMLKTLRLPSLKVITVLLCTLFVYDIFFVFITPLLTKVRFLFLCEWLAIFFLYSYDWMYEVSRQFFTKFVDRF